MYDIQGVLIIGNGFDLNLGLKTSYKDYMKWLKDNHFIQNSYLYEYLCKKDESNRWVDIENELRYYSSSISSMTASEKMRNERKIADFRKEYIQICTLLRKFLKEQECFSNFSKARDSEAVRLLGKLSKSYATPLYVISFNYTTLLDERLDIVMHHVHGALNKDDFVFGIEDGENINKQHSFLYKSYNQGLNINHLNDVLDEAEHISFFGYSLGQTDHSYFDDFFKQQSTAGCKRKKFDFYYYGHEAYDDLYWQLRTLTDKRVAKFRQFNDVSFIDIKNTNKINILG